MRKKTHPVAAILTSAYLSAMLTSSVAPINSNATLAAAIDPMAAQKALQNAASGLDAAGWAAAVSDIPSPSQAAPTAVPVKVTPKADPVMTDELMARLIKFTRSVPMTGGVDARICQIFDLCDGTKDMPLKMAEDETAPTGDHFFTLPLDADSKDILILVKYDTHIEAYLTDKSRNLRAACILKGGVARLITNEKAAAKFKAELSLFASEAASLPPTGAAAAGNS